jgi:hypothetical protein
MQGTRCGLTETLSRDLREGTEENHRQLFSIVRVPAHIQTAHFPNTSQNHQRLSQLKRVCNYRIVGIFINSLTMYFD